MSTFEKAPFILGMMNLNRQDRLSTPAALADWLEARADEGLVWCDHANIYGEGENERLFGEALINRPSLKSRLKVITKADIVPASLDTSRFQVKHYDTDPAYISQAIDAALQRLNVDRLDYFLLHRPDPLMDTEATAAALDAAVNAGKVGALGVSNFLPAQWRRLQAVLHHPLKANQIELSIVRSMALFDGLWDAMCLDGLKGMAYSPLAGGRLLENQLGRLVTELAHDYGVSAGGIGLAWLRRIPGRPTPVIGTLREQRIQELLTDAEFELERAAWFALLEAARACRVP